jgi:hypothetical protein
MGYLSRTAIICRMRVDYSFQGGRRETVLVKGRLFSDTGVWATGNAVDLIRDDTDGTVDLFESPMRFYVVGPGAVYALALFLMVCGYYRRG